VIFIIFIFIIIIIISGSLGEHFIVIKDSVIK